MGTETEKVKDIEVGTDEGVVNVICGANTVKLENTKPMTVAEVRKKMRESLNIDDDHIAILGDHELTPNEEKKIMIRGDADLEFKRPAGRKG